MASFLFFVICLNRGSSASIEMYTGADNGPTETYMMPCIGPNPQMALMQPPEGVDYMPSEMAPEAVYDQGLYYPAANYYGYYCTGFEPQSEWDDHQRFFSLDGQELHYSALQTESSPYVYYPPSYGYAQSSYNPYNPYIPGAVIGVDSPLIGTQQYFSNGSYQLPVSSPTAYIPVVVQPNPSGSVAPSVFETVSSIPSRQATAGSKHLQSRVSSNGGATTQGSALRIQKSESLQTASSELSVNVPPNKQSSSLGPAASANVTHMTQGKASGLMAVTDPFSHASVSSFQNSSKGLSNNLLPNFGSNVRGWAPVDRFRPRFQYTGAVKNGSPDVLGEQNRGPRTNKSKSQWASEVTGGTQMNKAAANNAQEAVVISTDQYNRDDFPVDYPDAKFFVIKSYSEDDVHKSIKYDVWSSTPNGNKRLHAAYEDAQRISAGKPRNCPIFLFFSVNASGQFCGVAEMIGPVDFNKDMDFWQQDKWTGSFPVKWHIIKDVPNTSFRHIILENNENKPVTNSRDTQEITYVPGMNMLNIFKASPLKTSILDDFLFYEERQKIMQEEKARYTGRRYETYVPAIVSAPKPIDLANQNDSADQTAKQDGTQSSVASDESLKADGKQGVDNLVTNDTVPVVLKHEKSLGDDGPLDCHVSPKPEATTSSDDRKAINLDQEDNADVASSVNRMKSLSIGSEEGCTEPVESTRSDVVTVGSMCIKVNGAAKPISEVITVGAIHVEPKAMEPDKKSMASDVNTSQK